jgi:hypothetical protein
MRKDTSVNVASHGTKTELDIDNFRISIKTLTPTSAKIDNNMKARAEAKQNLSDDLKNKVKWELLG